MGNEPVGRAGSPVKRYVLRLVEVCLLLILVLSCIFACVGASSLLRSGLFSIHHITSLNGQEANLTLGAGQNILTVEQRDSAAAQYPISVFKQEDGSFLWNTWNVAGDHPVDDGQRVYLWAAASGQLPALKALRLSDGKEVWQYADALSQPGSMQLVNGILYAAYSTGSGSYTVALDAITGALLWKDMTLVDTVTLGMQVVGPVMYLWGTRGLDVLRAQDGSVLWTWSDAGAINNQLVVQGNTLYFMSGYTVQAFAASTGKQLWSYTQNGNYASDLIGAMGGVVYVENGALLHAFRGSDGTILWSQVAEGASALQYRYGRDNSPQPFAMDSSLIYEMDRYTLTAFSTKDGTLLWSYTEEASTALPGVAVLGLVDGKVYVQIPRAEVVALDPSDGQQIWQTPGDSSVLLGTTLYIVQSVYSGDPTRDTTSPPPSTCRLTITLSSLDAQTGTANWQQKRLQPCT